MGPLETGKTVLVTPGTPPVVESLSIADHQDESAGPQSTSILGPRVEPLSKTLNTDKKMRVY